MLGEDGEDWRSVVRFMIWVGCVPLLMIWVGVPLLMIWVGCVPLLMIWVGCVKKGEEHGMLSVGSSSMSLSSISSGLESLVFGSCLFIPGVPGIEKAPTILREIDYKTVQVEVNGLAGDRMGKVISECSTKYQNGIVFKKSKA